MSALEANSCLLRDKKFVNGAWLYLNIKWAYHICISHMNDVSTSDKVQILKAWLQLNQPFGVLTSLKGVCSTYSVMVIWNAEIN